MTWFQSEIDCVRQWGHEEQWGHDQGFLCALLALQPGRDCLCFVEKEKMLKWSLFSPHLRKKSNFPILEFYFVPSRW